eukprot:CAMPEP_0184711880 /NCGR_PEP_ID=MMETSP0314-20130426/2510_1 /TAXON_ID=38298 /ORGANISM="Rhodella maculata, Strain CCMP 736" /LENGTH=52 /DNA_ID=CAMNT_0027174157 /DNA_START=1 /DNA_END=156 /DNA_ORIENTATION=-
MEPRDVAESSDDDDVVSENWEKIPKTFNASARKVTSVHSPATRPERAPKKPD